jgi:hypothetical protein
LNSRGSRDSGSQQSNTVSNGSGGRRKKSKNRYREEPTAKPNANSVSSKLLESVDATVDVLQELVTTLDVSQLSAVKITVQNGVDNMYSYANSYVASLVQAEMLSYDKSELIGMATDIMINAALLRKPFEETIVTNAGRTIAIDLLARIEINVIRSIAKLEAYITKSAAGELDVYIDDQPTPKKSRSSSRYNKSRRTSNGNYNNTTRGGSDRSDRATSNNGGSTSSPGSSTRSNGPSSRESSAISANNARERNSNYTGGGGPNPTGSYRETGTPGGGSTNFA